MDNFLGIGINVGVVDRTAGPISGIISNFGSLQRSAEQTVRSVNGLTDSLSMLAMSEAGQIISGVGNSVYNAGKKITGTMIELGKQVVQTGAKYETFRKTLTGLYDDNAKLAETQLNWAIDLAVRSPFQIEDVVKSMIGFKAIGVQVEKQYANAKGEMKSFLEYMGDLAAFRPDQGMAGILVAIRNLYGGDQRSFKTRLDIDPEMILGRELAKDPEGLTKDIVELSDKIAKGMMSNLEGTWMQITSNLQEQVERLFKGIADSGAFDAAKRSLKVISDLVSEMDYDEINKLGKTFSGVFEMLWKPIDLAAKALSRIIEGFKDLAEKHPGIAKIISAVAAMGGGILVASGLFLKLTGGVVQTVAAFTLMYDAMLRLKSTEGAFQGGVWRMVRGFRTLTFWIMRASILFAGAMFAYQLNIFGFRDAVDKVVGNVTSKWKKVQDMFQKGAYVKLEGLEGIERFFSKIMGFGDIFGALFGSDNGKEIEFTEEQFKRLNAVGLWDTAVRLSMLKGRAEELFKGMGEGFKQVIELGKKFYKEVLLPIGRWIGDNIPAVDNLMTKLLDLLGITAGDSSDLSYWNELGKKIGFVVAALLGIAGIGKIMKGVIAPFVTLYNWIRKSVLLLREAAGLSKNLGPNVPGGGTKPPGGGTPGAPGAGGNGTINSNPKPGSGGGTKLPGNYEPPKPQGSNLSRTGGTSKPGTNLPPRANRPTLTPEQVGNVFKPGSGGSLSRVETRGTGTRSPGANAIGAGLTVFFAELANLGADKVAEELFGTTAGQTKVPMPFAGDAGEYEYTKMGLLEKGIRLIRGEDLDKLADNYRTTNESNFGTQYDKGRLGIEYTMEQFMKDLQNGPVLPVPTYKPTELGKDPMQVLLEGQSQEALNKIADQQPITKKEAKDTLNSMNLLTKNTPVRIDQSQISSIVGELQGIKTATSNFKPISPMLQTIQTISTGEPSVPMLYKDTFPGMLNTETQKQLNLLPKYARGTITDTPHVGIFGEDGEEALIPLSDKHRDRGIALWEEAGKRLGIKKYAEGGITPKRGGSQPSGGNTTVDARTTIQNVTIKIDGTQTTDPKSQAQAILSELRKIVREERSKGLGNATLEDIIMQI
ncbi:hypothetical protein D1872_130150 [compost metagenome]